MAELVGRADLAFRSRTSAAVIEMEVKTASYERSFKIVAWDDSRDGERTLIKILGPALWRGYGTLKVGDQLKLYDPKTNHVQVVGHSMLGDAWMGSHFSNDDLVKETRLARDYRVSLLSKWTAGSPAGGEAVFYRVLLEPKPTAPVVWGKIVYELWEQGGATLPGRADYYRKAGDGAPARSIVFTEVEPLGGRTLPTVIVCTVASKPGESTRIKYRTLKLDVDIPAGKFTEQALRH
ncbi:MAG: outer membrane lipoprotein-sorting protein [Deltaproteobacteria bacterium]|nr:outer membrane lipoprotein-sorting protein [Deltaproteobacteria bacterium]